ncbi:hypothetical protein JTE90_003656 [Oedothorax gibbosus]|uniref:BTB domain-containing protein n=1 Tax=Oedothorax gibbosus TaxID=931172 RepID=A0AAV6VSK0_9ARAC|nr:hypothetical protein JTE90_003656 [Oedothorax gibbosus]
MDKEVGGCAWWGCGCAVMSSPVSEFREAHHYWLSNDIIRPKPRRLGDMSPPAKQDFREPSPLQRNCRTPSKDSAPGGPQTRTPSASRDIPARSASRSAKDVSSPSPSSVPEHSSKERPASCRTPNFGCNGPKQQMVQHAKSSPGLFEKDSRSFYDGGDMSPDGHLSPYADCGSLSKSSSDGDPIVCRRRPPTRLKSKRRNILSFPQVLGFDDARLLQRRHECYGGSSSDENKSSGHASMSDGQSSSYLSSSPTSGVLSKTDDEQRFGRGTPLKSVPEDAPAAAVRKQLPPQRRLPQQHHGRPTAAATTLEGACGLEDIRQAIEQLSVRTRTSYSTSTWSSTSYSSESEAAAHAQGGGAVRRLMRHSSLETVHTTAAGDEFVWVDNHARLVELQRVPWSNHDILKVMQTGRLREHLGRISMETVPRLSYLLQRPLVRVAREAQRLAKALGMCTKQEVSGSLRIVLAPALADSCVKACHRSAATWAVSGGGLRLSKGARAGLTLSVGRFHRWMCDVRLGPFVHQYAAIFLTAALENLLEEVVLRCLEEGGGGAMFSADTLEAAVAGSSDLWGLFQPFSHLNAGRTATGTLSLPRWPSQSDNSSGCSAHLAQEDTPPRSPCKSVEQHLLTTCVGSMAELGDLLRRVSQYFHHVQQGRGGTWAPAALHALYYFMRCSQLEHAENGAHRAPPAQELVYERPYLVLPPLIEWVRVATAHADHRRSPVVDKDDVMQAARLLLPGVDCPVREFGTGDDRPTAGIKHVDPASLQTELAFRLLWSGCRPDMVLALVPQVDAVSEQGLTPLMGACARGDEAMVHLLLDAGADVDAETPGPNSSHPYVNPETQHWTALTYATTHGHLSVVKLLLEKGANVEGGARLSEEKITVTPLQLAAASGRLKLAELLLVHGAHPFLATTAAGDAYGGAAQRGCYSALAVAGAHGQRPMLHLLLAQGTKGGGAGDVLSLEEILAEGAATCDRRNAPPGRLQVLPVSVEDLSKSSSSLHADSSQVIKLTKAQLKSLQEAMYHSAENGHIDITLDLRNIGVPWTLHCWMCTLAMAYELQVEPVIDQLLQDYLQGWPEDSSAQFVDECLPLLVTIFRHSKKEGTTLLLADIFSNCYSKEPIKEIRDVSCIGGARIDPTYVNNPEMSDVQFRVEGRVFYAHKIILVNASPRFKAMLKSAEGAPPVVQINDIRYDIFELVMQYLYKGGFENCKIDQNDILELMAAASFFQLDGLLRWCESRSSRLVDLDSVVSMYVHAKAYNALHLLEYCQG